MSEKWSRVSIEVREEVLLRESGSCRIVCMACCRSRADSLAPIRATSASLSDRLCLSL